MVASVRAWMEKENVDCFIVPSDDPHLRYIRQQTGFYPQAICVEEAITVGAFPYIQKPSGLLFSFPVSAPKNL